MNYKDFSQDQLAKAAQLQTPEEMLEFAKNEGIELSDEDLDKIAGGKRNWFTGDPVLVCPDCGSENCVDLHNGLLECNDCHVSWFVES